MGDWITASTPYLAPRAAGDSDPWAQEAAQAGHIGRHRVLSAGVEQPPAPIVGLLGIDSSSAAVLRRRIVTLDERPVEVADSWYPLAVAEGTGLAEPKPIKGGALRLLADLGYTAVRHTEDVSAVRLSDELADLLSLPMGETALELVRTSYTADDTPFEVAVMVMTRNMAPGVPRRLRYELRSG